MASMFWGEMSYVKYKPMSQHERLRYEWDFDIDEIDNNEDCRDLEYLDEEE